MTERVLSRGDVVEQAQLETGFREETALDARADSMSRLARSRSTLPAEIPLGLAGGRRLPSTSGAVRSAHQGQPTRFEPQSPWRSRNVLAAAKSSRNAR